MPGIRSAVIAVATVAMTGSVSEAQFEKNISVTFDGWNRTAAEGYELVFGYLNRNPDVVDVPIGSDNSVDPGGPDRGQPTTFLPGRQRIMFRMPVAKDFRGKFVWTLKYGGVTQTATASIDQNYSLDEGLEPPPTIGGGAPATIKALQPLVLVPHIGPAPKRGTAEVESGPRNRQAPPRLTIWWSKFRGPGSVSFGDDGTKSDEPVARGRGRREVALGTFSVTCANPPEVTCGRTTATFSAPGTYMLRVVAVERTASNAVMTVVVTP